MKNANQRLKSEFREKKEREETVQLVDISSGEKLYGLKVVEVIGVIRSPEIVKLPGSAEYILGIISFRGDVLTVIDLGRFLGEEEHPPEANSQVVIVSPGEKVFGISVDRVSEIREIPLKKIQRAEGEYVDGTYKLNEQSVRILDLKKMVQT